MLGSLQFSEACLRVYGHPDLLGVAASINGEDFTPFNEAIFIEEPGRGASVAWHRDGVTHWDSPDWDQGTHGYNTMAHLYGCTAANGVWVVPGSHLRPAAGEASADGATAVLAAAGDAIVFHQDLLHAGGPNLSSDIRYACYYRLSWADGGMEN